jgi:hypothetical protein
VDGQINNNKGETVATEVGVIHVMPKEYQGGAIPAWSKASVSVKKEISVASKKPVVVAQPIVKPQAQIPSKPQVASVVAVKKSNSRRVIIIVGAVVLLVMAIAAVVVVMSGDEPVVKNSEVPKVVVPTQEIETPMVSEPVSEPASEPAPEPFKPEPVAGRDTDSDGLSDIEERLFGSNTRLPDTDRDGFLDGNEVFNQYDPLRESPAKLLERSIVKKFDDTSVSWSFLYPSLWGVSIKTDESNQIHVLITVASGENIKLSSATKTAGTASLRDYVDDASNFEFTKTKSNLDIATEQNQMKAYIDLGDEVLVAEYLLNGKNTIDFISAFQMILNSVVAL